MDPAAEIVSINWGQVIDLASKITVAAALVVAILALVFDIVRPSKRTREDLAQLRQDAKDELARQKGEFEAREGLLVDQQGKRETLLVAERDRAVSLAEASQAREAESNQRLDRSVEAFAMATDLIVNAKVVTQGALGRKAKPQAQPADT